MRYSEGTPRLRIGPRGAVGNNNAGPRSQGGREPGEGRRGGGGVVRAGALFDLIPEPTMRNAPRAPGPNLNPDPDAELACARIETERRAQQGAQSMAGEPQRQQATTTTTTTTAVTRGRISAESRKMALN
jgi:hypothetical protein